MMQSNFRFIRSNRLSKKELFLWRTRQGYGFSVKHRAAITLQWRVKRKEGLNYHRFRLRRSTRWYRVYLMTGEERRALGIRRCL
jgi:hypothetical protein